MRVDFHIRTKERRARVRQMADETIAILAASPPAGRAPDEATNPWLVARRVKPAPIDHSKPMKLSDQARGLMDLPPLPIEDAPLQMEHSHEY